MALVDEIVPYHMSHNAGGWLLAGTGRGPVDG